MSIDGILMILWYAAKPWLWLIALLLLALVFSLWFGRHREGKSSPWLWLLSAIAGILAIALAPSLTNSQLSYVTTWPDRLVLLTIGIAAAGYCWLLCKDWVLSIR